MRPGVTPTTTARPSTFVTGARPSGAVTLDEHALHSGVRHKASQSTVPLGLSQCRSPVGLSPTPTVRVFRIRIPGTHYSLFPAGIESGDKGTAVDRPFVSGTVFCVDSMSDFSVYYRRGIPVSLFRAPFRSSGVTGPACSRLVLRMELFRRVAGVWPACVHGQGFSRYLLAVALARSFRNNHVFSPPVCREAIFHGAPYLALTRVSLSRADKGGYPSSPGSWLCRQDPMPESYFNAGSRLTSLTLSQVSSALRVRTLKAPGT
ncbi:hypothetical protein QTP88_029565 [Uroleucon formosanum]